MAVSAGRPIARASLAAMATGAGCVAYGTFVERNWYALRHATAPVLPPGSRTLRLLHISDLHLLARDAAKRRFLAELAELPIDLLVSTGDVLGEPAALGPALEALERFRPRLGKVGVLGSNDYYAPRLKNPLAYFRADHGKRLPAGRNPVERLVAGMESSGWLVLTNQRGWIGDIELAGMDDPHIDREDLSVPQPANGRRAAARIGVVHSPESRCLDAFTDAGYDLILAGHTHGGQVCVPGMGALVTNCDLPAFKVKGLSRHRTAWLHVSGGLGTSKYAPFRFACRPEATLLDLVARG